MYKAFVTTYFTLNALNVYRWRYMFETAWVLLIGSLLVAAEEPIKLWWTLPQFFVSGGWMILGSVLWVIALKRAYSQKYTLFMIVSAVDYLVYMICIYFVDGFINAPFVKNNDHRCILYALTNLWMLVLLCLQALLLYKKHRQKKEAKAAQRGITET